jgi:L-lactate utilization protein LutB
MKHNNNRLQRAVDIHLDSVNIHNALGNELVSLLNDIERLTLEEEEKETLKKCIESSRNSLFEYLDYVIQYTFDNMNEIETEL